MARIRSIKPTFWEDEKVNQLSIGARLLTIGLITMSDDQGRFLASATAIAGHVFPHGDQTPARILTWLGEIHDAGIIDLYTHGTLRYGHFPNWHRHQRISHPGPSRHPTPPNGTHPTPNPLQNDSGTIPEPHQNGSVPRARARIKD